LLGEGPRTHPSISPRLQITPTARITAYSTFTTQFNMINALSIVLVYPFSEVL